jgi:hypothetical protein
MIDEGASDDVGDVSGDSATRSGHGSRYGLVDVQALEDRSLSKGALRTLGILSSYANKGRIAWPAQTLLAERLGYSRRRVRTHVDELVDAGYVLTRPRRLPSGGFGVEYLVTPIWRHEEEAFLAAAEQAAGPRSGPTGHPATAQPMAPKSTRRRPKERAIAMAPKSATDGPHTGPRTDQGNRPVEQTIGNTGATQDRDARESANVKGLIEETTARIAEVRRGA